MSSKNCCCSVWPTARASAVIRRCTRWSSATFRGFMPTPEDEQQASRGFARVLATLERGIQTGIFRGRSAVDMGHQLWALVRGLAMLELWGALGGPRRAVQQWKDAATNLITGFRRVPG